MRKPQKLKTVVTITLLSTLLLFGATKLIPQVKADQGNAKVYILHLSGVCASWVDNPYHVIEGAIEACTPVGKHGNMPRAHPKYGETPPFYDVSYQVIYGWSTYVDVILNKVGVIVLNTHGQILPVPSGYNRTEWVDEIAEAMLMRRLTWTHMAGYPFYYVWFEGNTEKSEWGMDGFKTLMGHIGLGNVELWPPQSGLKVTVTGQASQNLFSDGSGWHKLHDYAYSVDLTRPLKKSDFEDYVVLPLYRRAEGTEVYWEGAVIAFAKPGARVDPEGTKGFGSFVHLGTNQTYNASYPDIATDKDYSRGYVVTAAAIWAETLGFEPRNTVVTCLA